LGIVIVDKTRHSKFENLSEIWAGIGGSIAMFVKDVEASAAEKSPNRGRGATTLTGTKDGEFVGMRVRGI
jgi:hypothetical protein